MGDLRDHELGDAIHNNPVWEKPIIELADNTFFICAPSIFHSFAFRHVDSLFQAAGLGRRYERRRAQFLEQEVQAAVLTSLPSAQLFSGSHYLLNGVRRENDLLVKIGNWLVVVEAKSHKLNRPAQRGAHDSLRVAVQKLIIEPSGQSASFAAFLAANPAHCRFERRKGPENDVNVSECVRILRLTVTLEPLGSLAAQVAVIRGAGFVPPDYKFAVTMNLLDLSIVLSTLKSEEERIDYLFRRAYVQDSSPVDGEERDLLVFYVAAQLRAEWSRSVQGDFLGIAGWRRKLDDYYLAPLEGRPAVQYTRQYTPLWQAMIDFVKQPPRSYWPEASALLLTFGYEEQLKIEKQIRQNVKDKTRGIARRLSMPGWDERIMVCFKAFRSEEIDYGIAKMEEEAMNLIQNRELDHVLWVAFTAAATLSTTRVGVKTNHARPLWV